MNPTNQGVNSQSKTHYELLAIERTATAREVKVAFHRVALTAHPDKGGDAAKFREFKAAYDCLKNPATRSAYDSTLSNNPVEVITVPDDDNEASASTSGPAEEPKFGSDEFDDIRSAFEKNEFKDQLSPGLDIDFEEIADQLSAGEFDEVDGNGYPTQRTEGHAGSSTSACTGPAFQAAGTEERKTVADLDLEDFKFSKQILAMAVEKFEIDKVKLARDQELMESAKLAFSHEKEALARLKVEINREKIQVDMTKKFLKQAKENPTNATSSTDVQDLQRREEQLKNDIAKLKNEEEWLIERKKKMDAEEVAFDEEKRLLKEDKKKFGKSSQKLAAHLALLEKDVTKVKSAELCLQQENFGFHQVRVQDYEVRISYWEARKAQHEQWSRHAQQQLGFFEGKLKNARKALDALKEKYKSKGERKFIEELQQRSVEDRGAGVPPMGGENRGPGVPPKGGEDRGPGGQKKRKDDDAPGHSKKKKF